jgi:hypothetical protein
MRATVSAESFDIGALETVIRTSTIDEGFSMRSSVTPLSVSALTAMTTTRFTFARFTIRRRLSSGLVERIERIGPRRPMLPAMPPSMRWSQRRSSATRARASSPSPRSAIFDRRNRGGERGVRRCAVS